MLNLIYWNKTKKKDFTEDKPEEDRAQALTFETNGDKCT